MATFGTFELPHVLTVSRSKERRIHELLVAWSEYGYRRDIGGYARKVTIGGEIRAASWETIRAQMEALADDTARMLDDGTGLDTFEAKMLTPKFDRSASDNITTLPYTVEFLEAV
jgi:hypothetical protein